jgi:hypothetical protein
VVNSGDTMQGAIREVECGWYVLGSHPEAVDMHEHHNPLEQSVLLVVAGVAGSKQTNHTLVVQQHLEVCVAELVLNGQAEAKLNCKHFCPANLAAVLVPAR